jgi:translocation and assembly module TamB
VQGKNQRKRLMRWIVGGLAAVASLVVILVVLAAGALWFVGKDLDRPWIKTRVLALAAEQGYAIDYEGLELSLGEGVSARAFRLLTPPALAAGGQDAVRVEQFELRAPLWKFALGSRTIESLRIGALHVTLVADESGRTTLSELFPPAPERNAEPSTPLSHSLAELPTLSVSALEVAAIAGRYVELFAGGAPRVSALRSLGLRGQLVSGERGLEGTSLELVGAPLAIERSQAGAVQRAALGVDLNVSASEARALAVALGVELERQDFVPSWGWRGQLLELKGTLRCDEAAGKTTLAIAPLAALRRDVLLEADVDVFDGEPTRFVSSGALHVALAGLPFAIEGLALDALKLDLTSKALSWDGARIAGTVESGGSLRGASYEGPAGVARIADLTLGGRGAFEPDGGRFEATLSAASLTSRSADATAEIADVRVELGGTTRELAGAQQVEARVQLSLASAQLGTGPGRSVTLGAATLRARAQASALELSARALSRLDAELSASNVEAVDPASRTQLDNPKLSAGVDRLVADDAAALGVQGDASLSLSLPALSRFEGSRRPALELGGLAMTLELPLSLARAQGTVALLSLRAGDSTFQQLALDVDAEEPLAWAADRDGARATLSGRLERVDAGGGNRGALTALRLVASKPERDRYRFELDATGARLAALGQSLPGEVQAEVRAEAQPVAGVVSLASALRGERGARVGLDLDASFERASERLKYALSLSAEKLEAFSPVAQKVDARVARLELGSARLTASARGDLAGVLRAAPGELPAPVANPLGSARGAQTARLELAGLDYRSPDVTLAVPQLAIELESTHRAGQGGKANARLSLEALDFAGAGRSIELRGLDQKLVATFERAPDQGLVDVHTSLSLGSAAQSWLPGYPVKDLALSTNMQIDRLRSIYLRELVLDNPASGSSLQAAGTLELLARANRSNERNPGNERNPASGKTIVGREALSFEGRLEQKMSPLERLDLASHATGTVLVPFRLESGGLIGYRLLATLEAKQVSFVRKDGTLAVDGLNGSIPIVEEFALLPSGPVISAGPRTSPLSDTRFFDVHPFLSQSDYVTARSLSLGGLAPLGPIAANVRLERTDFIIDQLQTGYRGGQIVGQVRVGWRDGDPIVRMRLNATGVRSGKSQDVFDANTALTFVPAAMTLDGKMQIVRASREHLEDILDVLDPYHEAANANRVRRALALGYPKFVRFQLHDGAVDTKVELGGIAGLVRIDEIRAVPLGPILQKYVAPALSGYLRPSAAPSPPAPVDPTLESARRDAGAGERSPGVVR